MSKDVRVYLEDILESIDMIERYVNGVAWRGFERDVQLQDAVMRRLEIIGEATKQVPEVIRKNYTDVPWKQISGMRDVLIHEYGEVRLERVWKTVKDDILPFKKIIKQILADKK